LYVGLQATVEFDEPPSLPIRTRRRNLFRMRAQGGQAVNSRG
jgi:hypothetical protein